MNLYIDGEWNGRKEELLSFAIVADDGRELYRVLDYEWDISPWVAENVIPVLGTNLRANPYLFKLELGLFLRQFQSIHVIADWPEDIAVFCELLILQPGERLDTPPLTMEVIRVDPVSKVPHNALWDARALKDMLTAA